MGIVPDHSPSIAQLRPGIVNVHINDMNDIKSFFISGGFAIIGVYNRDIVYLNDDMI